MSGGVSVALRLGPSAWPGVSAVKYGVHVLTLVLTAAIALMILALVIDWGYRLLKSEERGPASSRKSAQARQTKRGAADKAPAIVRQPAKTDA